MISLKNNSSKFFWMQLAFFAERGRVAHINTRSVMKISGKLEPKKDALRPFLKPGYFYKFTGKRLVFPVESFIIQIDSAVQRYKSKASGQSWSLGSIESQYVF
ncbi:hypothetical protein SDC9_107139 [bioreactor metagenome]|uniref:Uncharacterized protein n=1 Tax=bioreactor metagenome TaxID=1076179 RepID=A0A645B5E1_9ZZZZ